MKKNKKRSHGDTMLLTLCARCAAQFYNSPEHIIRRANPNQKEKDTCCYCSCKNGWDFTIQRRTKKK